PATTPTPPHSTRFPYTTLFRSRSGQREPACHSSIEAVEVQAQTRFGLGRGDPLEQVATGHAHPYERPHDGIAHEPRLVGEHRDRDRKSTRLNSSHVSISYAVFC